MPLPRQYLNIVKKWGHTFFLLCIFYLLILGPDNITKRNILQVSEFSRCHLFVTLETFWEWSLKLFLCFVDGFYALSEVYSWTRIRLQAFSSNSQVSSCRTPGYVLQYNWLPQSDHPISILLCLTLLISFFTGKSQYVWSTSWTNKLGFLCCRCHIVLKPNNLIQNLTYF